MHFVRNIILLFTAVSRHLTSPRIYLKNFVLGNIVILVLLVMNVESLCLALHRVSHRCSALKSVTALVQVV